MQSMYSSNTGFGYQESSSYNPKISHSSTKPVLYDMGPQQDGSSYNGRLTKPSKLVPVSTAPSEEAQGQVMSTSSSGSSYNQAPPSEHEKPRMTNDMSKRRMESSPEEAEIDFNQETGEPEKQPNQIRKRARKDGSKTINSDEDVTRKKHRGRPRINENETENIDRRRTQIREAQRAYRLRKEDTITTLSQKCDRLQHTIEEMSQSFLGLTEKFLAATPDNSLAPVVRSTTIHFLELARQSTDETGPEKKSPDTGSIEERAYTSASVQPDTEAFVRDVGQDSVWGYQIQNTERLPAPHFSSSRRPHSETVSYAQSKLTPGNGKMPEYLANISSNSYASFTNPGSEYVMPSPPITKELDLPGTHTYRESSFARRLQRRTLEKAYYVLMTPSIPQGVAQHVFRLSFCYNDRQGIIGRLRYLLGRNEKETLDNSAAPWTRLGGAGSHFQRNRPLQPTPSMPNWDMRSIGPQVPIRSPPGVEGECNDPENLIKLTSMDGEWFDSQDVEQYLRLKGLDVDSEYGLAQLRISNDPEPTDQMSTRTTDDGYASERRNSVTIDIPTTSGGGHGDQYASHLPNDDYDLQPNVENGYSDAYIDPTTFLDPSTAETTKDAAPALYSSAASRIFAMNDLQTRTVQQEEMTKPKPEPQNVTEVTVDVSRLIEELSSGAICLGRSPGFRRTEVDKAIRQTALVY